MSDHTGVIGVPAGFEDLTFIEPLPAANLLSATNTEVVLIDVREPHEFEAGHIPNAINMPSGQFSDEEFLKSIVEENAHKKTIIVHCMKSQQRGPTCGRALAKAIESYGTSNSDASVPAV